MKQTKGASAAPTGSPRTAGAPTTNHRVIPPPSDDDVFVPRDAAKTPESALVWGSMRLSISKSNAIFCTLCKTWYKYSDSAMPSLVKHCRRLHPDARPMSAAAAQAQRNPAAPPPAAAPQQQQQRPAPANAPGKVPAQPPAAPPAIARNPAKSTPPPRKRSAAKPSPPKLAPGQQQQQQPPTPANPPAPPPAPKRSTKLPRKPAAPAAAAPGAQPAATAAAAGGAGAAAASGAGAGAGRAGKLGVAQKTISKRRAQRQLKVIPAPDAVRALAETCQNLLFLSTGLSFFNARFQVPRSEAEARFVIRSPIKDMEASQSTQQLYMLGWAYSQMFSADMAALGYRFITAGIRHVARMTAPPPVEQWLTLVLPQRVARKKGPPKAPAPTQTPAQTPTQTPTPTPTPMQTEPAAGPEPGQGAPGEGAGGDNAGGSGDGDQAGTKTKAVKTESGRKRAVTLPPSVSKRIKTSPGGLNSPSGKVPGPGSSPQQLKLSKPSGESSAGSTGKTSSTTTSGRKPSAGQGTQSPRGSLKQKAKRILDTIDLT